MAEKTTTDAAQSAQSGGGLVGALLIGTIAAATSFATAFLSPSTGAASPLPEGQPQGKAMAASPKRSVEAAYVDLPELLVTIGAEPADRYIKMRVTLVVDTSSIKQVEAAEPMLLDAFTTYLRSVDPSDFEDPSFYGQMRNQLGARAQLVVGASSAQGVLITEFLLR